MPSDFMTVQPPTKVHWANRLIEDLKEHFSAQFAWTFDENDSVKVALADPEGSSIEPLYVPAEYLAGMSERNYLAFLETAIDWFASSLQRQQVITKLRDAVETISDTATIIRGRSSAGIWGTLETQVRQLQQQIDKLQVVQSGPTARVVLPEELAVNLVDASLLDRLEEYRSDETLGVTVFSFLIGFLSNFIVSWLTGGQAVITEGSIIAFLVLLVPALGAFLWLRRLRRRAAETKERMLGRELHP